MFFNKVLKKSGELFVPLSIGDMTVSDSVRHFYFVDFIRGISALVVLVWHYQHFFWTPQTGLDIDKTAQPFYALLMPFYTNGYWAVQLFWMISGFVFAYVYAQRKTDAVTYFTNRFSRLYPLHFVTLIIVAVLQYISMKCLGYFQIASFNDIWHFFLNIFILVTGVFMTVILLIHQFGQYRLKKVYLSFFSSCIE